MLRANALKHVICDVFFKLKILASGLNRLLVVLVWSYVQKKKKEEENNRNK